MKKTNLDYRLVLAFQTIFVSTFLSAFSATAAPGNFPSAYNYPSNALTLEFSGVSNNAANVILHGAQPAVEYEILSRANLTDAWTSEGTTRGSTNVQGTLAAVSLSGRSNVLFLSARYSDIGGLKLWLGADLGLTTSNSLISSWTDISGNTNSASQVSGSLRPLYVTNVINGHPVARFNGANNIMTVPFISGTNDFTMFVVAQTSAGEELDTQGATGSGGDTGEHYVLADQTLDMGYTNGGASLSFGTNGISVYEYQRNTSGPDSFPAAAVYSATVGSSPAIVTVKYAAKQPVIYLNGILSWTGVPSLRTNVFAPREIGGDSHGYFQGDIAEVLIFDRALSANERTIVELYLNNKYGVVTIAPAAAPVLTASAVSSNQVSLTWISSATNASIYHIERKIDSGGTYQEIATVNNLTTAYFDKGLNAGTQYDYRIRAANIAGNSPYSNETNATTSAVTVTLPLHDLKLWLMADAGMNENITGQVPLWFDQSGNANNASQVSGSLQPLYVTNVINGLPVARFNGANTIMTVPFISGTNDFTMFVVAQTSAGEELDAQGAIGIGGNTGEHYVLADQTLDMGYTNGGASLSFGTNGISVYEYQRNESSSDGFPAQAVYTNAVGTGPAIIAVNYVAKQPTIYLNNSQSWTGLTSARTTVIAPREIGGDSHGYFQGDIAEILIFDRVLTADERATVENYLNGKYAVTP